MSNESNKRPKSGVKAHPDTELSRSNPSRTRKDMAPETSTSLDLPDFPPDPMKELKRIDEIADDDERRRELEWFVTVNHSNLRTLKALFDKWVHGRDRGEVNADLEDIHDYIADWDEILVAASSCLEYGREFLQRRTGSRPSVGVAEPQDSPAQVHELVSSEWPKDYREVQRYLLEEYGKWRELQSLRKAATANPCRIKSIGEGRDRRFYKTDVDRYAMRQEAIADSTDSHSQPADSSTTIEYDRMSKDELKLLIEEIQEYNHGRLRPARFAIDQSIEEFVETHFHKKGTPVRAAPKIRWVNKGPLRLLMFLLVALTQAKIIILPSEETEGSKTKTMTLPEFAVAHFLRPDLSTETLKFDSMQSSMTNANELFEKVSKDWEANDDDETASEKYGDWIQMVYQHIAEFI